MRYNVAALACLNVLQGLDSKETLTVLFSFSTAPWSAF